MRPQPAILAPVPASARFLVLGFRPGADVTGAIARLADLRVDESMVIGLGEPLVRAASAAASVPAIPGLRPFPALAGGAIAYPSTQAALWTSIRGADAGETLLAARGVLQALGDLFVVEEEVLSFRYREGRDLSGYIDGTENPTDERAVETALVAGAGEAFDGSSFVAVQRWVHDLASIERLAPAARDALIGRRRDDNEEIADAPASAHVKRAAQESYDPAAFMVRRSMPWGSTREYGLYFVAYGRTLDPFERVLRRMAGLDDGVIDGLSQFSRAVSGGYYWCPPLRGERLDLRALGV